MTRRLLTTIGLALLTAGLLVLCPATAQADMEQDLQIWAPVTVEIQPHERWSAKLEGMVRWNQTLSNYNLTMLRPSVAFHWPNNDKISMEWRAGYMWAKYHEERFDEHRVYQETNTELPMGTTPLTLLYRMRNELRWFEAAGVGSPILRNRQLLGVAFPIKPTWTGIVYDEFHTNLIHNKFSQGAYNQNRVFIGVQKNWRPNAKRVGMETTLGYMLIHSNRRGPRNDGLNHAIVIKCDVTVQ